MIKIKNQNIYVVMYHYVKKVSENQYKKLKFLKLKEFNDQLNFFKSKFNVLENSQFIEIINSKKIPKKPSVLLTFDDGYIDHYKTVFPILMKNKLKANFYPPVDVIKNHKLLDINKLHIILSKQNNLNKILKFISNELKKNSLNLTKIISSDKMRNLINQRRYDDKKMNLIKILLQFYLPEKIREKILNDLFKLFSSESEKVVAKKFYMNVNQLKEMSKNGMTFGSHGYYHYNWSKINYISQKKEIEKSIEFYKKIKLYNNKEFSICYPFGEYNSDTIKLMKKLKISFGLTTKVSSVNHKTIKYRYILPRYDTNDFKL